MGRTATTTTTTATPTATACTAYGFAKVVNVKLKEAGLKELPAQMFYSYAKKGLIGTDAKPLTLEYAIVWTEAYIARKQERLQAAAEKLKAELNGEATKSDDHLNEPDVSTETATEQEQEQVQEPVEAE
jgi:hypothetical protein